MTLIQELEQLIERTGMHRDREVLERVLEYIKRTSTANSWAYYEDRKITRR